MALKNGAISHALRILSGLLDENPHDARAWQLLAAIQFRKRDYEQALASYDRAIELCPKDSHVWYNRAQALQKAGRSEDALASIETALRLNGTFPEALNIRGAILGSLGRVDSAVQSFKRSLELDPSHVPARYNLALALTDKDSLTEALIHFERAIEVGPDRPDIHNSLGIVLRKLKRYQDALESFERAIRLDPKSAPLHYNRGISLSSLGSFSEALASFDAAISISPGIPEFYSARADTLRRLRRFSEALGDYDRAINLDPGNAEYHSYRGSILLELSNPVAALEGFHYALSLAPLTSEYAYLCGTALEDLGRFGEAVTFYEKALHLDPAHPLAFNGLAASALSACDWNRVADIQAELPERIDEGNTVFFPFVLLGYGVAADLQLKATQRYLTKELGEIVPLPARRAENDGKIRVGYLSADFRAHATTYLITELLEHHDRSRFEIIGLSLCDDDGSHYRHRLIAAFDEFYELGHLTDHRAAEFINEHQIDICVDLNGHTKGARTGILARRPAPVQVSYLGYPATMGSCGIDYVLADETVLPNIEQAHFTEQIVHLPGTYQVNSNRATGSTRIYREKEGLPPVGFVYCCFNNSWKISSRIFETWMIVLSRVSQSVLWLFNDNRDACDNLRRAAHDYGIDPARLVFAEHRPQAEHVARLRLADLFLDTIPYNAHTTASDALFAGLPVLTIIGDSFQGRVAASLLYAMGMPELVTHDLEEYETTALKLALDPNLLRALTKQLSVNRDQSPVFKVEAFCRNLESAYSDIWRRAL